MPEPREKRPTNCRTLVAGFGLSAVVRADAKRRHRRAASHAGSRDISLSLAKDADLTTQLAQLSTLVDRPSRAPASFPDCLTHKCSDSEETPRSPATSSPNGRYAGTARLFPLALRRVRHLEVRSPWHGRTSSSPVRTLPTKRSGVHRNGGTPDRPWRLGSSGHEASAGMLYLRSQAALWQGLW
jgi:hypothetical protein